MVEEPLKQSGEALVSVELFQRFDGIMLDAMNTIFLAKAGRYALYQELLGTLGVKASLEDVERVYKEKRVFFEAEAAKARERGGVGDVGIGLWTKINGAIIQELAPDLVSDPLTMGSWVYEEFLGNPRYFMVPDSMRSLLKAVHGRIAVIIVSNQERAKLDRFISHFELGDLIDNVFSSEEVGYEKPDPRFFQTVLKVGIDPEKVLMVGNNIKNDIDGAKNVGIRSAVLLDWDNKSPEEQGVRRVTDPSQLLTMRFS